MTGLVIVAHAPLATALQAVAAHVFSDRVSALAAVDVPTDWTTEQVEQAVQAAVGRVRDPQALILVDVLSATPCNGAQRVADQCDPGVRLVAGVNVPMLWRALCYADEPLDQLVELALAGGVRGVVPVPAPSSPEQP
jgi:mannose PTS system EIIA component